MQKQSYRQTRITAYGIERTKALSKARLQLLKAQQVREATAAIAKALGIRPPTSTESLGDVLRRGVVKRDAGNDTIAKRAVGADLHLVPLASLTTKGKK